MLSEDKYIKKRKRQAMSLSFKFYLMRLFPINKKKIVFSTFEGDGGFCCNPRYIAEELNRRNKEYDLVWLTKDTTKQFPEYIRVKKSTPWNIAYHLSTASVWIDNYRKPYGTLKRRRQIYIQTWHASLGFKAVGLYRGDAFPQIARIVSESDSNLADVVLSNSEYCDKIYPKKLLYSGPTLRTGSPRVDCLINDKEKLRQKIRDSHNLGVNTKILLFAPTFRGGNQKGRKNVVAPIPTIDFDRIIAALEEKYNKKWVILLRLHPQLSAKMDEMPLNYKDSRLIDVSQDADINELIAACDMLITDYSSCAFDAMYAYIPVILYADDVEEYVKSRGKFMWHDGELPFATSQTNDELVSAISNFEIEEYAAQVVAFMEKHEIVEDGMACSRVADYIESRIVG